MGKPSPNNVYGPLLANLLQKLAVAIKTDCGASIVRITCEFVLRNGGGNLKIQTFTTPDAKTERLLDPDASMPRGSNLQQDAIAAIQNAFKGSGPGQLK